MPSAKQFIAGILVTVPAVILAGVLMNAFRDNDFIGNAIKGFDS